MTRLASVRDQLKHPSLFWIESSLAAASTLLAAVTVVVPDWIELSLRIDPDGGSGGLEWLFVFFFLGFGVLMFALARQASDSRDVPCPERPRC
jgi:hypothetical protein